MITKHVKMHQLETNRLKVDSNNDLLLNEISITINYNNTSSMANIIPQFTDFFIQGHQYIHHQSLAKLTISNLDQLTFNVSNTDSSYSFSNTNLSSLTIQHEHIVAWVREFKELMPIYRQTGATETVAVLLTDGTLFGIECITTSSAFTKLLGALIKKDYDFQPILFFSHKLNRETVKLTQLIKPEIIVCQSAISTAAFDDLHESGCTVFGFCRKNKFNRYSNFHI